MLFFAHIIQMQLRATTNDPAADPWVLPGIGSSVWPESEVSVDSHRTLVPPESGRSIRRAHLVCCFANKTLRSPVRFDGKAYWRLASLAALPHADISRLDVASKAIGVE